MGSEMRCRWGGRNSLNRTVRRCNREHHQVARVDLNRVHKHSSLTQVYARGEWIVSAYEGAIWLRQASAGLPRRAALILDRGDQ